VTRKQKWDGKSNQLSRCYCFWAKKSIYQTAFFVFCGTGMLKKTQFVQHEQLRASAEKMQL